MYDLALFGATGFTGRLVAEYLSRHALPGTRIVLAGRNEPELSRLAEQLPASAVFSTSLVDAADPAGLRELADSTRVVLSTVGPYVRYGEPMVSACASTGTDYVDLCGEPTFVNSVWLRHHDEAVRTGARVIHACGWTAVPHDLGVMRVIRRLEATQASGPVTVRCYATLSSSLSGGAFQSILANAARPAQAISADIRRRSREHRPAGSRDRASYWPAAQDRAIARWRLPYPTIETQIIRRSARSLGIYGSKFVYGNYVATDTLAGGAALRTMTAHRRAGTGPTPEERAKGWFKLRIVGRADGRTVATDVVGGDPWYDEASKLLAESALCLAFDELPASAGQLTPAAALGDALTARVFDAGIRFDDVEIGDQR